MSGPLVSIVNRTRGTTVAARCRVATSLRERTVGLLDRGGLAPDEGLLIERSPSIHMFFMRFAIDAVFLDAERRVVRVDANLRPWRVVLWARGARDCLELAAGTAAASTTMVGDQLDVGRAG